MSCASESIARVDHVGACRMVFEALTEDGKCIEKSVHCGELRCRRLRGVDLVAERVAAREALRVPAEMLTGDARARRLAIELIVIGEMRDDCRMCLGRARGNGQSRGKSRAGPARRVRS